MRTRLFLFITLFSICAVGQARVRYIPIQQLPTKAENIFLGEVESISTRVDGNMVFTDYHIRVEKWYKGEGGPYTTLSMAGGTHGSKSIGVSIATPLETGKKYILFTYKNSHGYANPIIGHAQGIFQVVQDAQAKSGGWIVDYHGYRLEQTATGILKRGRLTEIDAAGQLRLKPLDATPPPRAFFVVKDANGNPVPQDAKRLENPPRPTMSPVELHAFEAFIQAHLHPTHTKRLPGEWK